MTKTVQGKIRCSMCGRNVKDLTKAGYDVKAEDFKSISCIYIHEVCPICYDVVSVIAFEILEEERKEKAKLIKKLINVMEDYLER